MANLENAGEGRPQRSEDRAIKQRKPLVESTNIDRAIPITLFLGFLLVWEILARSGRISPLFFPAPTIIARGFTDWLLSGELLVEVRITFFRVLSGFIIGGSLGLLIGLMMGWSKRLRRILDPIFASIHPVPKITLLPIVLIIFGFGEFSRIFLISIAAFFPMLINSMAGVQQIPPIFFEVAEDYDAPRWLVFRRVILPGSLSQILTGARLALNLSLVITIVVELRMASVGLGSVLWMSWETLRTTYLYSTVFIIAFFGITMNYLLMSTQKWLIPWNENYPR